MLGLTGGHQGRLERVGSKSLKMVESQDTRKESRSGCQSIYLHLKTYKRSTTLYTRLELPYKEIVKTPECPKSRAKAVQAV